MKKTVISAAIVGVSLAGFKKDLDKAGDWYSKHDGAVDGAITTAATVAKALAYQNDNQFGVEQRAEWALKHSGDIAKAAAIFGDANDNQLGVEQRAEWALKHSGDIAKVAAVFGDANDNQYGFKQDADKAGDWYSKHDGAVDDAITTAAKVGKILADQDDEFGVKQRAEFVAKHGRTIAKIASLFGDQNDNELDFKSDMDKAGDWYSAHQGAVDGAVTTAATVGKILADANDNQLSALAQKAWHFFRYGPELAFGFKQDLDKAGDWYSAHDGAVDGAITTAATVAKTFADSNDNELDFKSDMDKAGDWYSAHQGAVDGAVTTAATVGKILAYENDDINERLRHDSNLKSLRGLQAPRRRGFLGN